MGNLVLLFLAITAFTVQNAGWKLFTARCYRAVSDTFFYNSVVAGLMAALFSGALLSADACSPATLLYGFAFGAANAACLVCITAALHRGSMVFTNLLNCASLLVPTLFGSLILKEPLTLWQAFGVIVLLGAFVLGVRPAPGAHNAFSWEWLLLAVAGSFCNGVLGVLQKLHSLHCAPQENPLFLCIGFLTTAVLMFAVAVGKKGVSGYQTLFCGRTKKLLILAAGIAVGGGAGNGLILLLSGRMAANVLFPVANGGIMAGASLAAVAFFRERLTRRQWMAVAGSLIGIVLVSNLLG